MDIAHLLPYLQVLEPEHYQTHRFYWSAQHPDPQHTPRRRQFFGDVATALPDLVAYNEAGYGIFIAINAIDAPSTQGGYARRRKSDISRVRAIVADWDKAGVAPPELPLPPSMTVVTSPGKFHFYWCTDDMSLEQYEQAQRGIVTALGSDASVIDLSRELRVPGSMHTKTEERPVVRLLSGVDGFGTHYPAAMLLDAFPFEPRKATHEAWDGSMRIKSALTAAAVAYLFGPPKADEGRAYIVPCPWEADHSRETSKSATVYYPPSADNGGQGYFLCKHDHCAQRTASDYDQWLADRVQQALPPK